MLELLPRVVSVLQITEYLETLHLFGNPDGGNNDGWLHMITVKHTYLG